ncbi:hypothetical protein Q3G72_029466 [Acer saccharum]|nr:hypothetical protein Q3G72_029466 [Acer saccharum]
MQAGGVGLIFAQFGDNWLDPCVLIPCNKVGHKFFHTSEKQVLRLQSSDFPIVLKGNGYLQTIHKLLPFSSTGPSSRSQAVLKEYFVPAMFKYRACDGAVTENCPDKHEQKQYFRLVMNERVFL